MRHIVGSVCDFAAGTAAIVELAGRSVGILNVGGTLYAVRNACPHHGAPLCEGTVSGRMVTSRPHEYVYDATRPVLRCPWHGYEFDLANGRSTACPDALRVRTYRVEIENNEVVVYT